MHVNLRVTTRNARFQQWQALLANRKKRQRAGAFVVQGVRPITVAVDRGWPIDSVLVDPELSMSRWATDIVERLERSGAEVIAVAAELLRELGGKAAEEVPELLVIARLPADDLARIDPVPPFLAVALDRPSSPGNIGTIVRSVDAFGGSGVIVTGHAADPYEPQAVRASTGSLFTVPIVRVGSPRAIADWVRSLRVGGEAVRIVGTDEAGDVDVSGCDLTASTLLLVGNESSGLSASWRELCDQMVRIPIGGTASSLNAAVATSVVLYEASRQRGAG